MSKSERWQLTLAVAASMSLAPCLTALHNASHDAPGIVVSGNAGINLWLGNNPNWRETIAARPGIYYDLEYRRPTQVGLTNMTARERYFVELVMNDLRANPFAAAKRTLEKAYLLTHGREIRRDQDLLWSRENSAVAAGLMWEWGICFPFGLLLPLALACPGQALRSHTKSIIIIGVVFYVFAIAWFVVAARYRLPVVVLLIPIASASIVSLIHLMRRQPGIKDLWSRWNWLALGCGLALCNAPYAFSRTFAASPTERLLLYGQAYAAKKDIDRALKYTREAVELSPRDPDARIQLGQFMLSVGQPWEAARHFQIAGKIVPEAEAPWILHGHAMMALRRYRDAIYNFTSALQRNPFQREALRDLGWTYALAGQPELAIDVFRRYFSARYVDDATSLRLARLLLDSHEPEAALAILLDLERRHPHWVEVKRLIGRIRQ